MSTTAAEKTVTVPAQRIERQPLPARIIPDPLEGVIEGANPAERYRKFTADVLGKIWTANEGDEYSDDFHRPARFDRRFDEGADPDVWISGYTQFSPAGRDPVNLAPEEFDTMVANLGTPDYVRLRSVPPQLLSAETRPMHVGGSCVIETWGERTMKEEKAGIKAGVLAPDVLPETARQLVDLAPSITHASGALLGGYDRGVHLIETDMWAERIALDYGVPREEADRITKDAYRRIHEMVQRRSKLINPDAVIVEVNFDELGLTHAVEQWMTEDVGIPYDPAFRIAEVMHTYAGPNQMNLVKGAIQRQLDANGHSGPVRQAMEALMDSTHHMRGKQIDHLRWGSMDLPKDVIMGLREPTEKEQEKMAADPAYARGILIMQEIYRRHMTGNPTSIAAGFADLPTYGKKVQHETRLNFTGKPATPEETRLFLASVEKQFTDPVRLHRKNVPQHLDYLQGYLADTKTEKQAMSAQMNNLQAGLGPLRKARQGVEKAQSAVSQNETVVADNEAFIAFCRQVQSGSLTGGDHEQNRKYALRVKDTAQKALGGVRKRIAEASANKYDPADAERLPEVIEAMAQIEEGTLPVLSETASNYLGETVERTVRSNTESCASKQLQLKAAQDALDNTITADPGLTVIEERVEQLKLRMNSLVSPSYFPLSENPFVHHAMQFLWDPDFAVFMRESVRIHEQRSSGEIKKDESNEQMRRLMGLIYPKLEAYINYLFGKSEYPAEMRSSLLLAN